MIESSVWLNLHSVHVCARVCVLWSDLERLSRERDTKGSTKRQKAFNSQQTKESRLVVDECNYTTHQNDFREKGDKHTHTHTVSVREGLIRGEQLVKPRGGDKGCSPVTII